MSHITIKTRNLELATCLLGVGRNHKLARGIDESCDAEGELCCAVYALQSIAHTVDVYADTQNPATVGSLQFTAADEVLETFYTHKGPWLIHDMNKLTNASLSYDLIVYVDWYAPDSVGPSDKSLRGDAHAAVGWFYQASLCTDLHAAKAVKGSLKHLSMYCS